MAIIKAFFTQGMICLHRSNLDGLDYILGDPKAIHQSHTKPDFCDEWDTYVGELAKKCYTENLTVMPNWIRPNLDFFFASDENFYR